MIRLVCRIVRKNQKEKKRKCVIELFIFLSRSMPRSEVLADGRLVYA